MRELGRQAYITSKGVAVKCSAYVDDAEHYGAGAAQLRPIMDDLSLGGAATGIGFAWNKFSAYATDWEEYCSTPAGADDGVTNEGIAVTGYDIWQGGTIHETVPRAFADTEERLLGKSGCIRDRHTIAREETIRTLANTRSHIYQKRASWDEVAAYVQMMVRGIIAYCPLDGIPHPSYLHNEDRALQQLLLKRMGIRSSAERGSLCPKKGRGTQITSVVESTIASVCKDIHLLINGTTKAAVLGRDELREGMHIHPEVSDDYTGLVTNAIRFLSGYGIHVCVATDKTVCRILEALPKAHTPHQSIVASYHHTSYQNGLELCRIRKKPTPYDLQYQGALAAMGPYTTYAMPTCGTTISSPS